MKKNNVYIKITIVISIVISIFILFQKLLYSSNNNNNNYNNSYNNSYINNVSRLKEKFYTVIEPGNEDITVLQKNFQGETNVYRPNIYYKFKDQKEQKENRFDLDNYF
jgi:hypothetical protein